jgi:hypothetical protein
MARSLTYRLENHMLRTVFMIGLFALLGLFALKLAFGLFGFLFALLLIALGWAVKIAIIGLVIYFVIRIVSPDTASRLRSKWTGP